MTAASLSSPEPELSHGVEAHRPDGNPAEDVRKTETSNIPVFPYSTDSKEPSLGPTTPALPHDDANVRGRDPLGSRPRDADTGIAAIPVSRTRAHDASPAPRGPLVVDSTPDFIAAAKDFYTTWTANETEGQKAHAKTRSTVFSFMQYRTHPDTDEPLWTREQWDEMIAALDADGVLLHHAAIWHDQDTMADGRTKPLHFHGVIRLLPGAEKQVRFLAIRASLPGSRIRTPSDSYAEGKIVTGRLAADLAEFDFCQYLVHEDERSRDEDKYQYPRDEVIANFDFSAFMDAGRPAKAKGNGKLTDVDKLALRVQEEGLTLRQAQLADPLAFNRAKSRMVESRSTYLQYAAMPNKRENFYFGGASGTGKTEVGMMLALVLAQIMYPDLTPEEAIFVVGRKGVEFQKYDGQPILVWDDYRPLSLINAFGGDRDALWPALDIHPKPLDVNRKYGSIRLVNAVNIITGIQSHTEFLRGLAGTFRSRDGVEHEAEDPVQAFRRFGWVNEVSEESIRFYFDQGFAGTGIYGEYEHYATVRANMRKVSETLAAVKDPDDRERVRLANGQRMFASMVDARLSLGPSKVLAAEDALAELGRLVEVVDGDQLAPAHESHMLDKLRARRGYDRPEVLAHFRDHHLSGLDTPEPDFIYWSNNAHWCDYGHPYVVLSAAQTTD